MLVVKDADVKDYQELIERFEFTLSLNLDVPTFVYILKLDDQIIGYGVVEHKDQEMRITKYSVLGEYQEYSLFFVKAIGNKVEQRGFSEMISYCDLGVDHPAIIKRDQYQIIPFRWLFTGSCGHQ